MACEQPDIIVNGSIVGIESPFELTTNSTVPNVSTTITLPDGTLYQSHTVSSGIIALISATELLWTVPLLSKLDTVTLDLEVIIQDEITFSEGTRLAEAVTDPVAGEVVVVNNESEREICGLTCSDVNCDGGVRGSGSTHITNISNNYFTNGLIYGGAVWIGELEFDITEVRFLIDGIVYTNDPASIILTMADAIFARIDVIVANDDGTITSIAGVAAENPAKPEINTSSQVEITTINVLANALEPEGFLQTVLHEDNIGSPGEWDAVESTGLLRINLQSNSDPFDGNFHILGTSVLNGDNIILVGGTSINTAIIDQLNFRIKSGGHWNGGTLQFTFYNDSVVASNTVTLIHSGIFNTYLTEYQLIAFPGSQFNFTQTEVNKLKIESKKTVKSFSLDSINIVTGIETPSTEPYSTAEYITNTVQMEGFDSNVTVVVGDVEKVVTIPQSMHGAKLVNAVASVAAKGITGETEIQIKNTRAGVTYDMLSQNIILGNEWFAENGIVDWSADTVQTGDRLQINVHALHTGTSPIGLSVVLEFTK